MKLSEIYNSSETKISFEIFPPKGENYEAKLEELKIELIKLKEINPALISITYGACGSNRNSTIEIAKMVKEKIGVIPMQHLTCICSSLQFIQEYIKEIEDMGLENVLALKGDEPKDNLVCYKDFLYANELVEYIKKHSALEVAVAGYPEKHPSAPSLEDDIKRLKTKVDTGAVCIFNQMCFDNNNFLKYRDLCTASGITKPQIAGIFPITNYKQIKRITSMCNAQIPKKLVENLEKYKDNQEDIIKYGIDFASEQCAELMQEGVAGLHFYTLNKAEATLKILENIR